LLLNTHSLYYSYYIPVTSIAGNLPDWNIALQRPYLYSANEQTSLDAIMLHKLYINWLLVGMYYSFHNAEFWI